MIPRMGVVSVSWVFLLWLWMPFGFDFHNTPGCTPASLPQALASNSTGLFTLSLEPSFLSRHPTSSCCSSPSAGTGTGDGEEPPRAWLAVAQHMCWDLLSACCLSASFELTYVSIAAHLSPSLPLFPPSLCTGRCRWSAGSLSPSPLGGPLGSDRHFISLCCSGRAGCLMGAVFGGILVWMQARLRCVELWQFPPSTIDSGAPHYC